MSSFSIIAGFVAVLLFFIFLQNYNQHVFWLSALLIFDPGGFFTGYLNSDIVWRIKYYDVFFFVMFVCFLNDKRFEKGDRYYFKIRNVAIAISCFYFFITGLMIPLLNDYIDLTFFIQKNRLYFYSVPIFLFVYHFSIRSIDIFYNLLLISSTIILASFIITILTPIDIVPMMSMDRYGKGDRMFMISYGLLYWTMTMGIIIIMRPGFFKLKYKNLIYFCAFIMVIAELMTLTRRSYLSLAATVLIIIFLFSWFENTLGFSKVIKMLLAFGALSLFLSYFMSQSIDRSTQLINDTYTLLTTGEDTRGIEDYRITGNGDLLIVKDIISKNPLLGIGYYPADWSDIINMKRSGSKLALALDASAEVPIYGAIMRLGIIGLILPTMLYFLIFKITRNGLLFVKRNFKHIDEYPIEMFLLIFIIVTIIIKFTINIYNSYVEFYSPSMFSYWLFVYGMLMGIVERIKRKGEIAETDK